MKNLALLNDNTTFKLNDTGTVIQFKASNEGQPVGLSSGQSAVFRIKNEFGFLKSVQATTTYGGYVFELDTSNLSDLVAGSYDIELAITLNADDVLIFPDDGFVSIKITENALNITGEQLPLMSLEDFKDELKTYVTNQTTQLKSDFDTYVESVKQGPQGEQGEPGKDGTNGADGEAATINIGTVSTLESNQEATVSNSGDSTNAVFNFGIPKGVKGEKGDIGETGAPGIIGDYCYSTGWQDLNPYMNADVFQGYGGDTTLGKNFYAVTSINGVNIFWFKLDTAIKDATAVNTWGTKLFNIPSDVVSQYKSLGLETSQFNTMLEVAGVPVVCQLVGAETDSPYLQVRGWLPVVNNGNQATMPTGNARVVHYTGWFVL